VPSSLANASTGAIANGRSSNIYVAAGKCGERRDWHARENRRNIFVTNRETAFLLLKILVYICGMGSLCCNYVGMVTVWLLRQVAWIEVVTLSPPDTGFAPIPVAALPLQ
jgi:hypothetical protein